VKQLASSAIPTPQQIKGAKCMAKVVTFNDVYQIQLTIRESDDELQNLEIVYGLVDSDGIKWTSKFWTILPEELSTGEKAFINNLMNAVENKVKIKEGI
jgi:hypothetical protein